MENNHLPTNQQAKSVPSPPDGIYQSENIKYCKDGKYRWVYEFNMYRNPAILFVVLKIMGGLLLIPIFFIFVKPLFEGQSLVDIYEENKYGLLFFLVFFCLIFLAYLIVAAINGGKYVVLFEMDETGVLHRQMKSQTTKAEALGKLLILAGLANGNLTSVGVGINTATKTSSYSEFASVRSVKPQRRYHLIKVNEPFCKNQIYLEDEDFDFVYNYIITRCPKVKSRNKT